MAMTDKEKLERIKALSDKMYTSMQNLTTDTVPIRKAMNEYHQFIIQHWHEKEPVSKNLLGIAIEPEETIGTSPHSRMTKDDIKLILKAFYHVNSIIRTSYDAHHAFKYAATDEYLDKILETYTKLKKEIEK